MHATCATRQEMVEGVLADDDMKQITHHRQRKSTAERFGDVPAAAPALGWSTILV